MNRTMPATETLPTQLAWYDKAVCRHASNPDMFFNDRSARSAKAVCRKCPVWQPCLSNALNAEQGLRLALRAGVFGGLTAAERFKLEHAHTD